MRAAASATRSCCRSTSSSRCSSSRCSSRSRCCATTARYGNFRSAGVPSARWSSTSSCSGAGWAPRVSNTQIANVWDEFARGCFAFYISGPWNIGEFSSACRRELQDTWTTAPLPGPDGARASRSPAARAWCCSRARSTRTRRGQLIEYLSAARACRRASTRSPATCRRAARRWTTPALATIAVRARFRDAARARRSRRRRCRSGSASRTEMRLVGRARVHGALTVDEAAAALDRARRRDPGEAALDAATQAGACT